MSTDRELCIPHNTSHEHSTSIGSHEKTRKRPRTDDDDACDIDTRSFSVQPSPADPFARAQTFNPICLLTRSQLPLAFLDTLRSGSRLFTATIPILDACHECKNGKDVLIVEDEQDARLYAIESARRREYALCRIGSWVRKEELAERSRAVITNAAPQPKRQALSSADEGKPWWMAATGVVMPESRASVERKTPMLSMQPTENIEPAKRPQKTGNLLAQDATPDLQSPDEAAKPASPEEALEELTKQYLDTLYLSRTPIAYFVKGPLARARAALSQSLELAAFLRGTILSHSVIDKKYSEIVAEMVKELPILETPDAKPNSRRRRKWKPKRDKLGLFGEEKDFVEQWWRKGDDSYLASSPGESMAAAIKRRAEDLRRRETFLQIILILEIMALEAAIPPQLAASEGESQPTEPPAEVPAKKSRKKKELRVADVLDNNLERVCIWFSLEGTPSKAKNSDQVSATDSTSDDLKSFASEVIIPFYGARIPNGAYSASKRLGGPKAPAPVKRQTSSALRKPGDPAPRPAPDKKRRGPLQRISTEILNKTGNRPPVLQRSATDTQALEPSIKREATLTPSLDSIPYAKSARPGARKSASSVGHFSRREVDLDAISQASTAKLQRKASARQSNATELLSASISNIKKPNRERALQDAAKEVDEQFARVLAKGRNNSVKQQRKGPEKHVSDTPRHVKATPAPKRRQNMPLTDRDSGATSRVPSSSARLLAPAGDFVPGSSFAVPQTGHRPRHTNMVDETPSRGFAKFMPANLSRAPGTLLESPTATRSASILQTPAKGSRIPALMETPVKKLSSIPSSTRKEQTAEQVAEEPEEIQGDIYAALGWNDDY